MTKTAEKKLNAEQEARLIKFAQEHGKMWRRKLNDMWFDGRDANQPDGHLLRQIRNYYGPTWLASWKHPDVK